MKRLISLLLSLSLLATAGCQRKKERLSAPTTALQISPSVARVAANAQKTFTAKLFSPNGAPLDASEASWSLSSDTLGQILPDTGAQTTFYAGQALGVTGTLKATLNGMTASAQIAVGADTGNPATSYGFFSESLVNGMQLDIPNSADGGNGGFLGAGGGTGGGGASGSMQLADATTAGLFTEGTKALKATVSGDATSYAFFYFSFGFPDVANISNDLSAFANGFVKFDIRAPAGRTIKIILEWEPNNPGSYPKVAISPTYSVFDDQYHSVSIPISAFTGVDLAKLEGVTFLVDVGDANGTFTFYLDNLRFER